MFAKDIHSGVHVNSIMREIGNTRGINLLRHNRSKVSRLAAAGLQRSTSQHKLGGWLVDGLLGIESLKWLQVSAVAATPIVSENSHELLGSLG